MAATESDELWGGGPTQAADELSSTEYNSTYTGRDRRSTLARTLLPRQVRVSG